MHRSWTTSRADCERLLVNQSGSSSAADLIYYPKLAGPDFLWKSGALPSSPAIRIPLAQMRWSRSQESDYQSIMRIGSPSSFTIREVLLIARRSALIAH